MKAPIVALSVLFLIHGVAYGHLGDERSLTGGGSSSGMGGGSKFARMTLVGDGSTDEFKCPSEIEVRVEGRQGEIIAPENLSRSEIDYREGRLWLIQTTKSGQRVECAFEFDRK